MRRVLLATVLLSAALCLASPAALGLSPPGAPTGVTASDDRVLCVRVAWDATSSATYYNVYRATGARGVKTFIGSTSTGLQFEDTTAEVGETYWYAVKACNGAGCGDYSETTTGSLLEPPAAPTNFSATDGQFAGSVGINWTPSSGADFYKVIRVVPGETSGQTWTAYGMGSIDSPPLTGMLYDYAAQACVSGVDTSVCSNWSGPNSGWASGPVPDAPSVNASDGTHAGQVVVTYNLVANASGYTIWRSQSQVKPASSLDCDDDGYYADTSVVPGVTYYYWVDACNLDGCSDMLAPDTGHAGVTPTATSNPTATNTPGATAQPTATSNPTATNTPGPSSTPAATLCLPMIWRITPK